jgi:hypothetical protein
VLKAGVVSRLGITISLLLVSMMVLFAAPAFAAELPMECNVAIPNTNDAYFSCSFETPESGTAWGAYASQPGAYSGGEGFVSAPFSGSQAQFHLETGDDTNWVADPFPADTDICFGLDESWNDYLCDQTVSYTAGDPYPDYPGEEEEETPAHIEAITGAAGQMKDDTIAVGTATLPYAAGVLVLVIGWLFVKRHIIG